MIKIREIYEDEFLKAAELWSDFMEFNARFNDSFAVNKDARETFSREMAEHFGKRDYRLAVAEDNGQLAGFCFSYISRKPKFFSLQKFGLIGDLYIKPSHRRMGIGKQLVADAMDFFAQHQINQIELLVAMKNTNAIEFWESLGFTHLLTWMYKRT